MPIKWIKIFFKKIKNANENSKMRMDRLLHGVNNQFI